jgi:hypothetical protein
MPWRHIRHAGHRLLLLLLLLHVHVHQLLLLIVYCTHVMLHLCIDLCLLIPACFESFFTGTAVNAVAAAGVAIGR